MSRIIWGGRASLSVGLIATMIAISTGMSWGAVSGYAGGKTDSITMRLTAVLLAFPNLLLARPLCRGWRSSWS